MGLREFFEKIADNRRPQTRLQAGVQRALDFATPFYAGGAMLNRLLHEAGVLTRNTLPVPVLSVGNITMGGTGKSPFVIWLVERLRRLGRRPAILTRGYGRDDESKLVIVHDGKSLLASTAQAGDEPVMLALALGNVPVIACSDRTRAGKVALRRFKVDTLILDDGFQHHRLARQGEFVLVDSTRRLSSLRLTPRGSLRERPATLNRAHLIVLTRCNQSSSAKVVAAEVAKAAPRIPTIRTRIVPEGVYTLRGRRIPDAQVRGAKAVVLCGVGNPASVGKTAREAGLAVKKLLALPDHARVNKTAVLKADLLRQRMRADFLIVTEKDAVKLRELGELPQEIVVLRAKVETASPQDERTAMRVLRARLHNKSVRGFLGGK